MKRQSLLSMFCLLTVAAIVGYLVGFGTGTWSIADVYATQENAHSQDKAIEQAYSRNPQVRVTQLRVGQQLRRFDERFNEGDDWLRTLSFDFENISNKPIVYLQVNFNFPETRASGNLMSYPVILGQRPNSRFPNNNAPLRLMPGETLDISLSEHYDRLARFIGTRHSINTIHRAQVEIGFVVFEDGTAWTAGGFLRQDSSNPDRYINIEMR